MDSDDENDKDFDSAINMTGFMFGNIDENGELEDDILDSEAKQHLSSLSQFGLSSLLQEMMRSEVENEKSNNEEPEKDNKDKENESEKDKDNKNQDLQNEDYLTKSPTALDFSDINELADDNCEENTSMFFFTLILINVSLSRLYIIMCVFSKKVADNSMLNLM